MNEFEQEFKETQLQLVKGKKGRKPDAKTEVLPVEVSDTESLLSLIIQTGDEMRVNGQAKYENSPDGLQKFKEKTTDYFRFLLSQNQDADDLGEVRLLRGPALRQRGNRHGQSPGRGPAIPRSLVRTQCSQPLPELRRFRGFQS